MRAKSNLTNAVLVPSIAIMQSELKQVTDYQSLDGSSDDVLFVMKQLSVLFESAQALFNMLPDQVQHKILHYHSEGTSINHCLRWGENSVKYIRDNPAAVAI